MSEYPSMYDAAIEYAKKGFAVFPLKYRDKVPLTRNGCKDATTDAAQIKAWWQKYPNANIGLATGSVSQNVFVIDLDIDEDRGIDGYHSLEDWQREHGDFPETWTAITGRGGYHLYYRGNGKIKNRAGIIDGVDIRGNGGYVVAPPSIHKNGNRYEWEYSPDEFEIAKADNNVEYFLNHDDHRQSASFTMPNIVSAGQRNQMLFRFACMQKVWQGKYREDSMLTREATYEDYGFSEDEDKRLGEFCKNLEMRDKILLLQCAAEVYPNIVDELYCCIVIGMSYDKMNKKKFVALDRKDFYAYRKKTLAVFRAALQACNRYPF